ncbi:MAG: hypothetical protein K2H64_11690 [Desulfovibrio sp.]|nr:hypothetical protein [Desulfovibrio sp.]
MEKSVFLRNRAEWEKIFPLKRNVNWTGGKIENGYCADCRLCCGPQGDDDPFPMALLDEQTGPANALDFFMMDSHTACLGRDGCKSLGPAGCKLEQSRRPPACGLFPVVLIDGRLYFYKACPAVTLASSQELEALALKALKYLKNLPEKDCRRISISIPADEIAKKYIDTGLEVFVGIKSLRG